MKTTLRHLFIWLIMIAYCLSVGCQKSTDHHELPPGTLVTWAISARPGYRDTLTINGTSYRAHYTLKYFATDSKGKKIGDLRKDEIRRIER